MIFPHATREMETSSSSSTQWQSVISTEEHSVVIKVTGFRFRQNFQVNVSSVLIIEHSALEQISQDSVSLEMF